MLGKLFKHEWLSITRMFVPLYCAVIIVTLIGKLLLSTNAMDSMPALLQGFSMFIYVVLIVITFAGTYLYLIIHFYQDFYTDRGYLMNTLPVTASSKILSKLFVGSLYSIISFVVCAGSIFILALSKNFLKQFKEWITIIRNGVESDLNMDFTLFIVYIVILALLSLIAQMLMAYAAISLGQVFGTHRVLGAFLSYAGLYIVIQTFSSIVISCLHLGNKDISTSKVFYVVMITCTILSLVEMIAFYFVSNIMMKKHLNME